MKKNDATLSEWYDTADVEYTGILRSIDKIEMD